jgi:hypothetical protein
LVKESLRAPEPSPRWAHPATECQVLADPKGTSDGAQRRARVEVRLVRPFEACEIIVVATEHVRGSGEQLHVVGR